MDIAGWERMYRSGERGQEDAPTRLLVETCAKLTPGTAIDLACGAGRNAIYLAEQGWRTTAVDGSGSAIQKLCQRAAERNIGITARVADLTSPAFALPADSYDLVVIAFYLQRDLFARVKPSMRDGGTLVAIVHTPELGEPPTDKRAARGELLELLAGWEILHSYEGPSRDPAHRRPVAEVVARRC